MKLFGCFAQVPRLFSALEEGRSRAPLLLGALGLHRVDVSA